MCRQKKSWRVERRHWRHSIGLDSLSQKTPMFTPKKRTVMPRDAFENTAFLQWFENVRCSREAALHLFVEQIPPTDYWHQVDSLRCSFHALMPALTLVSLLDRYLVLETAMPRGDIRKRPPAALHIYSQCEYITSSSDIYVQTHKTLQCSSFDYF